MHGLGYEDTQKGGIREHDYEESDLSFDAGKRVSP
jgi:hypothetical protein